jgi:rhamnosyltransferase
MSEKEKNFCVYAGYHKKSRIRPDVFEQIKSLSSKYSIIYVISAEDSIKKDPLYFEISKLTSKIIIRDNLGYDFGSWKTGIKYLGEKLKDVNSLLLMNDSLYGPIFPMDQLICETLDSSFDIVSMTASEQFGYHGQSYYVSYSNKVINNKLFQFFWNNCPIKNIDSYEDKIKMILKYEVRFFHILLKMGFSHKCLFNIQDTLNPTIYSWDKLINTGMPFIKNALLFDGQEKFTEATIDFNKLNSYLNKNHSILNKMKQFWVENSEKPINIKY